MGDLARLEYQLEWIAIKLLRPLQREGHRVRLDLLLEIIEQACAEVRAERQGRGHRWALGWPGNFCLDCGLDDWMELAIVCRDCYVPTDDDMMAQDPVVRLCPIHQAMADLECESHARDPGRA